MYQKTTKRLSTQVNKGLSSATLALQTLAWVAFSVRPLHIEELRHALAFESNVIDIDRENLTSPRIIVSACLGLLKINEFNNCAFVHISAYNFFRCYFDADEVNLDIARPCVGYLGLQPFADGACHNQQSMDERLQRYPLVLYSAQYLEFHVKNCEAALRDGLTSVLHCHNSLRAYPSFSTIDIGGMRASIYSRSTPYQRAERRCSSHVELGLLSRPARYLTPVLRLMKPMTKAGLLYTQQHRMVNCGW